LYPAAATPQHALIFTPALYCDPVIIFRYALERSVPPLLLVVPVLSTLLGGILALRLRRYLGPLLALSAGLLLGAAALDLLPEAWSLQREAHRGIGLLVLLATLSFLGFLALQRGLEAWMKRERSTLSPRAWGRIGGGMLIAHSFRDGMAIGLSYAASHPAGYIVATGIAAHDIGDGLSTVLLSTAGNAPTALDYGLLLADALAPVAGALLTAWIPFSLASSAAMLAIAAGFFLELALVELLPQLRSHATPARYTVPIVAAGALIIFTATRLLALLH
jgi:zinc transporter ZupT